jgi:hypothetical protein
LPSSSPPTKISPRSSRSRARSTECRGEQKTVTTELHFPLDTQACIFWLCNRRRRNWNFTTEALLEGPDIAAQLETPTKARATPPSDQNGGLAETIRRFRATDL